MSQQEVRYAGEAAPAMVIPEPPAEAETGRNPLKMAALAGLILFALAYPFVFTFPYQQHIAILIYTYGLMAVAWNILGGYTGQVSLGNTVFFGMGAYASTFLLMKFLISPWVGMLAGIALSVLLAVIVGYPCFRLSGHYFAIATIAVGEILYTIVINTQELGAAVGLSLPILPESWINMEFHGTTKAPYYYIILAFLSLTLFAVYKIERSRLGFYFRAIKQDLTAARALGINATMYKAIAFAISAVICSVAGTFYAQYVLFIDPASVLFLQVSIAMCLMAVLGGVETLWGPVIGAAVLIGLQETTRVALGGTGQAMDLMIYGFLIMVIAVYQPAGLMGIWNQFSRRKK